jgi:hypothetical protein
MPPGTTLPHSHRRRPDVGRAVRRRPAFRAPCTTRTTRLALALLLLAAPAAGAQDLVGRADSLLSVGRPFSAETLYYAAVRREPHDPTARLALGRYLAARGALKVGAVLMEEARFFGGDAAEVARALAPVYARLGDYRALDALPATPLGRAERARVEWLHNNRATPDGPDSVAVPYEPRERGALGSVTLGIGADSVEAVVDPAARGLTLDPAWMRHKESKVFPAGSHDPRAAVGVTREVRIGELSLGDVPTRYGSGGGARRATVGLDVLATLTPTFDARARRLTLRKPGQWSGDAVGSARVDLSAARAVRVPTLDTAGGLLVIGRDGAWPLASDRGRALVRGTRVTVNARRGELVVN